MPVRRHRLASIIVPAVFSLLMLGSLAGPAAASSKFKLDLYFASGYERQVDGRTCTAASTAMMLNFIARRDLHLDQMSILRFEQPVDALNDRVQRGSDPLGWSIAATEFSAREDIPSAYAWKAYNSQSAALRTAALAIARYHKPVGLAIWHGGHAVVMTGFEATGNPALGGHWTLTAVYISDPYGAHHARYAPALRSPLNAYLKLDATTRYDKAWYRKYVIIQPLS